jgi:cation transport regulator ChaC
MSTDILNWAFSGVGGAILGSLIAWLITYLSTRRRAVEVPTTSFKYFSPPDGDDFNEPFYDYFIAKINNAKRQIYLTGDGFGCKNLTGIRIAENYHDAIRRALRRGLTVVRIQTSRNTSQRWAEMLAELVGEFPAQFELFLPRESIGASMVSVCALDPEIADNCLVEMMITSRTIFGTTHADVAGAAIFIERNQKLARELRNGIVNMEPRALAFRVSDPKMVHELLAPRTLYFAYGSNMSAEQMMARVRNARRLETGVVNDHRIEFNRKGSYRAGGVASIVHAAGANTYGVIWEIPEAEVSVLSKIEDPQAYEPITIDVMSDSGRFYECLAYRAYPQGSFEPDPEYLEVVIKAAREAQLPKKYIASLEAFRKSG